MASSDLHRQFFSQSAKLHLLHGQMQKRLAALHPSDLGVDAEATTH
jgi:hypothetical protein